ncbi:MAG: hypothetical protein ACRDRG_20280 [Pseudonocardiaceae bacterium]
MTDNHRPRSALHLAEQGLRRPRRDPAASAPKISEADRLSPAELARQREQAIGRRPMRWKRNGN